ncbi:hypothetical protein D3C80_2218990 [compost metagenome]
MWQLDRAATKASSGSTAASSDRGGGIMGEGADDPRTTAPPSKRQSWPRPYLLSLKG